MLGKPTRVGDELPPATIGPLCMEDIVRYQGASGDLNPHHYDTEIAQAAGFDRFFVPGMLQASFIGSMIADAYGAQSIRRIRVRFEELVWLGDTVTCSARVERIHNLNGEDCVELTMACTRSDGVVAVSGVATVVTG